MIRIAFSPRWTSARMRNATIERHHHRTLDNRSNRNSSGSFPGATTTQTAKWLAEKCSRPTRWKKHTTKISHVTNTNQNYGLKMISNRHSVRVKHTKNITPLKKFGTRSITVRAQPPRGTTPRTITSRTNITKNACKMACTLKRISPRHARVASSRLCINTSDVISLMYQRGNCLFSVL